MEYLEFSRYYELIFNLFGNRLYYKCKVINSNGNFVTFVDKNNNLYTYSLRYLETSKRREYICKAVDFDDVLKVGKHCALVFRCYRDDVNGNIITFNHVDITYVGVKNIKFRDSEKEYDINLNRLIYAKDNEAIDENSLNSYYNGKIMENKNYY